MNSNEIAALVDAQNRTTHAVRAIGILVITSAIFDVIGGFIVGVSSASADRYSSGPNGGVIFGMLIIGIGNLIALINAGSELSKSKVVAARRYATQPQYAQPAYYQPMPTPAATDAVACANCEAFNSRAYIRCRNCGAAL